LNTRTGQEIGSIDVPAKRPTSCCFGGSGFDQLFITSSKDGVNGDELQQYPLTGSVFRATNVGARGRAGNVFKGQV